MKYNRSEIMKNAWGMYNFEKKECGYRGREMNKSFGYFLRMAWIGAKNAAAAAEREAARKAELAELSQNKNQFSGKAIIDGYSFRLWENYGKRRIYIGNNGAFIDCDNNNSICSKNSDTIRVAEKFLASYAL